MRTAPSIVLLATSAFAASLATFATAQDVEIEAEIVPLAGWTYDDLYASGVSVDEMIGADVYGPGDEDIGDVENVLFSADGQALSVIAEIGGFLELGDTHVSIPWDMVSAADWNEGIEVPITEATVGDYSLFVDELLTVEDAASEVQEVEGDNLGMVDTGPAVWRATDIIGDYARLREGEGYFNYGYVDDLILRDGQIAAVVANPDAGFGRGGYYAYPYYGRGLVPGADTYDLPYERAEVEALEPFDEDALEG